MIVRLATKTIPAFHPSVFCLFAFWGPALGDAPGHEEPNRGVVDPDMVQAIIDEGMHRSRIEEDIRYLTDIIGPRLTGSPAMIRASEWTASKMREYGLDDVRLEGWLFGRGWEASYYAGHMTTPFVKPLHGISLAWSGSTHGAQAGEAVLFDRLTPERLSREVEIPITPEELRKEGERHERLFQIRRRLAELGALGILHRSVFRSGVLGPTEAILGEVIPPEVLEVGGESALPNVLLSDSDYALIYRNVVAGVEVVLEFDIQNRYIEDQPISHNTIGDIRGSDLRDEFVIIGAHLDSWIGGSGVSDNATGSIVALEAMRILSAVQAQPRRTIRIGLWSGEEPERPYHGGLLESAAYTQDHAQELEKTSVYFNLDQGTGRIRGIWEQNNIAAANIIDQAMRPLRHLGIVGIKPGFFVGSDDRNFAAAGVPAFPFVHDDPVLVYHTDADTHEAIQLADLKQSAIVVAVTAYQLAMRDERLPRQ